MMEKTVPGLFPVLSFYDDYLAEVGTAEYQAGDTLALVAPHFLAHGVGDSDIAWEAKDAKVCLGVEEYIAGLKKDGWEVRIISTAYSQMWELIGQHLGIPMKDIACTRLNLADLRRRFGSEYFSQIVRSLEEKILALGPLAQEAIEEVDGGKPVVEVWTDARFVPLRDALDQFYWRDLPSLEYQTLEVVQVMGGRRKIEAAKRFAQELGVSLSEVAYVGDSITDDALHAHLRQEGGLPIAINGNSYALRNAGVAVATRDMRDLRPLLNAWQGGAFEGVQQFVRGTNEMSLLKNKERAPIIESPSQVCYDLIDPADTETFRKILAVHKEFRRLVRGAATARLG